MKLLVDENLPRRLADWFRKVGHEAKHVSELGLLGQSDQAVWRAAISQQAGIVTWDGDFLTLAGQSRNAVVIRLLIGNCSTPVLIARVEQLWPEIEARIARGDLVIEIG